MKIRSLREHYTTPDRGKSWKPKRAFNNTDEIIAAKLYPSLWFSYECGTCGKFHVSKLANKLRKPANVY